MPKDAVPSTSGGRFVAGLFVAAGLLFTANARAEKPAVPVGGFPVMIQANNSVTYSDGYQTLGNLTYPDSSVAVPPGGWPLLVLVHGLGGSRNSVNGATFAREGYAVWAYDVRGQGDAALLNNPNSTTGWAWYGPNEKADLAEQIEFARNQFSSIVSPTIVAVAGPSQGGAHSWFAAAHSGLPLTVPNRNPINFPVIAAALPGLMVADVADTQVRDGMIMSYLMVRTAANPAPLVSKDAATQAQILQFALADDGPGLAAAWAADPARNWGHLLDTSTVPVHLFHPWHDGIGPPQPVYERLETLDGPWRAYFSTGGHLTPFNDYEDLFFFQSQLRWLDHFVWGVSNGIDLEKRVVLAEIPTDPTLLNNPTHEWGHRSDDDLNPADTAPWRLYLDANTLSETEPVAAAGSFTLDHQVAVGFDPAAWLADPLIQPINALLTKIPLDELVYSSAPLAEETDLAGQATVHLTVTPQAPRFQITALLSVTPPGATEDFMLAAWGSEVRGATVGQPQGVDIKIGGVATQLAAGTIVKLSLRNLWIVESPMLRDLQGWPSFTPFQVDIHHASGMSASYVELPRSESVRPTLTPAINTFSISSPAAITLHLNGGELRASADYIVLMGASGEAPGTPVTGGVLPLKWDALTSLATSMLGFPLFNDFLDDLDPKGSATVSLPLGGSSLPPSVVGQRITFASWIQGPHAAVSNAANVIFEP